MDPVPKWKKELIERIRNKNKYSGPDEQQQQHRPAEDGQKAAEEEVVGRAVQQPSESSSAAAACSSSGSVAAGCPCESVGGGRCDSSDMVKERVWQPFGAEGAVMGNGTNNDKSDSESSEDLSYGPGIVNRLKNRYLNLTLRESRPVRPSILSMRKATSLEDLLDDPPIRASRPYESRFKGGDQTRNGNNRYRNATRGGDMKRARSVETISRSSEQRAIDLCHDAKREEIVVISKEGNDTQNGRAKIKLDVDVVEVKPRLNRPKRIATVMSEREKPPMDVVKQTKRIFEGRPEQRTKTPHHTGEVAAKIASFKSILSQSKPTIITAPVPKPAIRQKPNNIPQTPTRSNRKPIKILTNGNAEAKTSKSNWKPRKPSPTPNIPDISRVTSPTKTEPDTPCNTNNTLSETPDLIVHSSPTRNISSPIFKIVATDNFLKAEISYVNKTSYTPKPTIKDEEIEEDLNDGCKLITTESRQNIRKAGNTFLYNLANSNANNQHLPKTDLDPEKEDEFPLIATKPIAPLTPLEIEKNFKNTVKTLEQGNGVSAVLTVKCVKELAVEVPKPKKLPARDKEQNSIVFKFTDRKDVPDYVGNDGRIRTGKVEKPKVGEGGIILLPGASLGESATDDDEDDWMLSLEGPPSPCDVVFVNDNVLIDGRSSLSQRNKKSKLRIQFVEAVPEIFEYPSEDSVLIELPIPSTSISNSNGQTVPSLSGTTLSSYVPKSGLSCDDFQLGITKTVPEAKSLAVDIMTEELQEIEEPVVFSAGTNADILF